MPPGDYPLKLYRGDSSKWKFVIWADVDKTQPADLTGVTAAAQVKNAIDGELYMDLLCEIELPNIVNVSLLPSYWETEGYKAGVWDLELTYPSGEVTTIVAGKVTITPDVTNAYNYQSPLRAIS